MTSDGEAGCLSIASQHSLAELDSNMVSQLITLLQYVVSGDI